MLDTIISTILSIATGVLQKEIAEKYNVSVSYISQLKREMHETDYPQYLKFLYNFMNDYMRPNDRLPPENLLNKIDEIGEAVNVIKR